eukprot:CAMPEP_0197309900 /NCGR_PEP_ID=MMETSP0891-20130614/8511_1 /TAXON_ID=44058 ORGANISM="Aureoumbra lagunensis, Strain CCMP1510" /NCGR_SAMPLE_ID=MMETSP0891 /ASSEMBLY_ACC=CAM_ASM_000534 /LENGTH=654 /DNA_ID=CAMNT_0042795259 /DNA_START=29 /DNA_END=1993 /DNA_ORIENTATION=-
MSKVKRRRYERRQVSEKIWHAFRQEWVSADGEEEEENGLIVDDLKEEENSQWVPLKERRRKQEEKLDHIPVTTTVDEENFVASTIEKEEVLVPGLRKMKDDAPLQRNTDRSLFLEAVELRAGHPDNESWEARRRKEEEERLIQEARRAQTQALVSVQERAHNTRFTDSIKTSWRPSAKIERMNSIDADAIRKKYSILIQGNDVPKPIKSFKDMGLPQMLIRQLQKYGIKKPTPIQIQGLPIALSGRDMIGVAFTGSGKTLTFCLPLIVRAIEKGFCIGPGQGPIGFVLCPSRELARQTRDVIQKFSECLRFESEQNINSLRIGLAVGGEDKRSQLEIIRRQGIHCLVATPGRLGDFLRRRHLNFEHCEYLCLDEGDRMLDLGFDQEVQQIINFFQHQRQTLLFSATMPQKIRDFAQAVLVRPIIINVSRAGATSLNVVQQVEYVQQEAKIVYLLECLQKTAPPVVIFCERKKDVDDIYEYLLLKEIDAVAIHGDKHQQERNDALSAFRNNQKDVLVATDVAAKGLDFPDIKHVINFDLPAEIEHYVHRIGRTGRCGKAGLATTFINKSCEPAALLDLRALLAEAKQHIPPVLQALDPEPTQRLADHAHSSTGCAFCGGLGHRITECPKRTKDARKVNANHRDYIAGAGGYGGEY